MRYIKFLFLLVLLVFSVMFFTQNNDTLSQGLSLVLDIPSVVTLHSVLLPFGVLLSFAFVAGALLTLLYFAVDKFRTMSTMREYRTRMSSLEQELNSLRNMPITEEQSYSEVKEEENA
ncbi:LapA family protein [Pseudodesulfovibrio sediminis]|uniref:Lipopolysaccharide assembly protein A domain-containing protein n=1 Tax=Pseudodesulfovibrio sediminis TaxID=2810563 RepID=A0ABM7P325_9BACT|nr:LapA family protein [Pseudodesulfovibrio sediminis]BCS87179.1 hypothetical protein PSDVSF_04210 [Pseudodesulfovibrio sediminis]